MGKKTKMPVLPAPPGHLRKETAAWWTTIVTEYELEASDLRVLEAACTQWDRAENARAAIAASNGGAYIHDRFGQLKSHPALADERDAIRLFLAAMRQLGIGLEPPSGNRLPDPVSPIERT